MQVVVPFAADEPKTRLAETFSSEERRAFALAMLDDVLATIRSTGREPRVLSTRRIDIDAPLGVDSRPLTPAVNAVLADDRPTAIVMADLALATPTALERLFSAEDDVVIAPGRGGGTNALVSRHPEFRVDYHGTSYLDHLGIASQRTLTRCPTSRRY
jgi:2-phospho-L-lactate guanylyltransferase